MPLAGWVSIHSPSGLLQNDKGPRAAPARRMVSIPSPSGLLQNRKSTSITLTTAFQSLLLQVSFKTADRLVGSPERRFNPFSFRSPSKPGSAGGTITCWVSIPSPSGLLQNEAGGDFGRPHPFQSLLLQVSFKTISLRGKPMQRVSIPSPSGLLQNSDRHPRWRPNRGFQSLLLQVSFKTSGVLYLGSTLLFQSLLLQVSFKTEELPGGFCVSRFNPFSFRSPSKRPRRRCRWLVAFQSLLLQVSFKTPGITVLASRYGFNPFSFRSPSKRGNRHADRHGQEFQSLLLQVSFKTLHRREMRRRKQFQSLLLQVSFKTSFHLYATCPAGFNPFSFRSPSKPSAAPRRSINASFNPFSFRSPSKLTAIGTTPTMLVSIPSPSGLLQNHSSLGLLKRARFNPFSFRSPSKRGSSRLASRCPGVSIPSPSGLLQNNAVG